MKELLNEEEISQLESVVVAKMGDVESLCDAFRGCHGIFHTSSFIDPRGISGYTVSSFVFSFCFFLSFFEQKTSIDQHQ